MGPGKPGGGWGVLGGAGGGGGDSLLNEGIGGSLWDGATWAET